MARKKKSMIGFDPLAWLGDDEEGAVSEKKPTAKKKAAKPAVEKKKATKDKVSKDKEELVKVLGQTIDFTALVKGYDLVKDSIEDVVGDFYTELFSQHPGVVPLFDNTDEAGRANKLSSALKLLFDNLSDEPTLKTVLKDLGERHQAYGAEEAHYGEVARILIDTCKKHAGRSWTKKITTAWEGLLTGVAETMLAAYQQQDESTEEVEQSEETSEVVETIEGDVLTLNSIQDISKSDELKGEILSLVKGSKNIKIDATDVGRIDGSALQLLCGLFAHAKTHDITLSWIDPSDALVASAEYLGVHEQIGLDYFGLF
jgi:hemoglobin-like flavoprotein/anti-anti-sigma regulatory factor